jgi:hypothetical protein
MQQLAGTLAGAAERFGFAVLVLQPWDHQFAAALALTHAFQSHVHDARRARRGRRENIAGEGGRLSSTR